MSLKRLAAPSAQPVAIETTRTALIGSAVPAETFLLIETPQPWSKPALLSEGIPEELRQVLRSRLVGRAGLRVHLIADEETPHRSERRILLFQRPGGLAQRYQGYSRTARPGQLATVLAELFRAQEASSEQAAAQGWSDSAVVEADARAQWLAAARAGFQCIEQERHLVVCTHASHNQCCGLLGYPFYQDALSRVAELGLSQTKLWQVSHIGGHRFAPTLIDLPQGRYYGNLDQTRLDLLLQQEGELSSLLECYRGWSLLDKPLQILEHHLWQQQGWQWLEQSVAGLALERSEVKAGVPAGQVAVELISQKGQQLPIAYHAQIANHQVQRCHRLHWRKGTPSEADCESGWGATA